MYGCSLFCVPHRPNQSNIFDLCLHWVSIVRGCSHFQVSNARIPRKIQIPATKSDLLSRQAFDFNWHSFPYVLPSLPQTALNIKGQKFRHPSENIEKIHTYVQSYLGEKKFTSILSFTNIFFWYQDYLNPEFQKKKSSHF